MGFNIYDKDIPGFLDAKLAHAIREISDTYGDKVYIKPKSLLKFGRTLNADANQKTTVMTLPGATQYDETYLSSNLITLVFVTLQGPGNKILAKYVKICKEL